MAKLKVAIKDTYTVDLDEILSKVVLKVPRREARKAVRSEVVYLVSEWCERLMNCPDLTEDYLALHLCREDLAEPREPVPEHWRRVLDR